MSTDLQASPPPETSTNTLLAGPWDEAGRCRTTIDGREVRVQGAIPGERVAVRITGRSGGAPVDWAEVIEVLDPAPDGPSRRTPPCPLHGACGACGLQFADPAGRLAIRVRSTLATLSPALGAALAPESDWIDAPEEFGYRTKAILLPDVDDTGFRLGGFARGTHDVVDLAECRVLTPALLEADRAIRARLQPLMTGGNIAATPPGTAIGRRPGLRAVVLRANRAGQVLATFVGTGKKPARMLRPLAAGLVKSGALTGAFLQEHDGRGDSVTNRRRPKLLAGARTLQEVVNDRPFTLTPLGFFQVNPDVAEQIALRVREATRGCSSLVDLYCGGGVLGLTAADGVPLLGIDTVEASIESATRDAGDSDARFLAGTPSELLGAHGPTGAGLVLDPPRAGCRPEDLDAALALAPTVIVYVSCSTSSLARDATKIEAAGYRPRTLIPADMLPQTPHIEWVAVWDAAVD